MTLNLTLLTADAIYQSADFRLIDGNTNEPLHAESMKLVTVHYPSWEGFVTYTGIGRWKERDTAEWIIEWLTGLEDASPDDVLERLRERSTTLLRAIERAPGGRRHPHTFVFASFVNGKPRVATISNFEDCGGRSDEPPSAELRVDSREMRKGPLLLATGRKRAIRRAFRRELERAAARADTSPLRQSRYGKRARPLARSALNSLVLRCLGLRRAFSVTGRRGHLVGDRSSCHASSQAEGRPPTRTALRTAKD